MDADLIRREMEEARRRQQEERNTQVDRLVRQLRAHSIFGKSQPAFDFDFVEALLIAYGEQQLRQELNKMVVWLLAKPERRKKNYRKFVANWMSRSQTPIVYQIQGEKDE